MFAPQLFQFILGIPDIAANRRPHLHHDWCISAFTRSCRMSLPFFDDLGMNVRSQIPSLGIDRLVLLFNTKRERWFHRDTTQPAGGQLAETV